MYSLAIYLLELVPVRLPTAILGLRGPPAAARCGGVTNPTTESTGTRSGDLRSN